MAATMILALLIFLTLAALVITNRIGGGTYVGKVLLALDYFVSVLWSRDFGITISSQCGLYWRGGNPPLFWFLLHRLLNALQPGHCERAIQSDLARAQLAVKLLS